MPNTIVETIKDIVTILTPVALALIAYKQVQLNNKQSSIEKKVDGMTSALVVAEKGKSSAEGKLEGMATAKQEVIEAAKVVATEVQEVKIVEQAKPIDVNVKKEEKK